MKSIFPLLVLAAAAYFFLSAPPINTAALPAPLGVSAPEQMTYLDIDELYDDRTTLAELAEPGYYTVIEIYSEHCGICKRLTKRYPGLIDEREDFNIKRVQVFSGSIQFATQQEANVFFDRQDAIRDFYNFYGTPHIEIYDDKGNVIAKDEGGNKPGFATLRHWLGM